MMGSMSGGGKGGGMSGSTWQNFGSFFSKGAGKAAGGMSAAK